MADLLERIGRVFEAYMRLSQDILAVVVSPECHAELRRMLRVRRDPDFAQLKREGDEYWVFDRNFAGLRMLGEDTPLVIDQKAHGPDAFRFETRAGRVTPQMAITRAKVNLSQH